ncbi:MAG: DISARM system helicase DrmA [Pseudomonadota bacterium]
MTAPATSSAAVRARLIDALRLDLVGPRPGHPPHASLAEEQLPIAPSKWYLTGFLVPYEAPASQRADDDGDDTLDLVDRPAEADDDGAPEVASARKAFFPSSMGLSVLVAADCAQLHVRVAWADYAPAARTGGEAEDGAEEPAEAQSAIPEERTGRGRWQRMPREAERFVNVDAVTRRPVERPLPGYEDLKIVVSVRAVAETGLVPAGTRAVSVFLVNRRPPAPDVRRDAAYVFQPELSLHSLQPFVPRPDLHGRDSEDWDEKVADLQYRDAVEFAVGHNVSALAVRDGAGRCREVKTAWMPTADVEKVVARPVPGVELGMEALAGAADAATLRAQVGPLVAEYRRWLRTQARQLPEGAQRKEVARTLLENAERAAGRIQAGLDALDDPLVLDAFRIANRAIATAIRQRACHGRDDLTPEQVAPPAWYPFQLAFLLMNVAGTADGAHPDRRLVDLLFFPTGGGKTEAYLGLAAFAMVLRRLRDPTVRSAGLTVLMRYTLRLLTLDQLGRAATLVCALELERQQDVAKLGPWPFEIGLWVGQTATPNRMGRKGDKDTHSARARTIAFQNDSGRKPSPIPLENCPWCGWKFTKDSFKLLPDADEPDDLRVMCVQRRCAFHSRRQPRGIPVLAVDEPIYRRLPAFLIATVDKFASLPWVGEAAGLFGRVQRADQDGFYGPAHPNRGQPLPGPLPPPDLVIQDELHLISGPLGTLVGLYETAIDALSGASLDEHAVRPKIVASTATVRRAERQIRGLFGRAGVEVFPPPGPDRRDSFFALTVGSDQRNPRTYVGVAAQGRNLKVVLLRSYLALLAAAQKAWTENGGAKNPRNPADPYMTLLGYFNALRELGGSRRIVEDEVTTRLVDYGQRRRRVGEREGLFADRPRLTEPHELTSRVKTHEVAETKRRLALGFAEKERVDVALASNMISVGLDITRLGLMVVLGQPKTTAEYIQATSRVGRDDGRPGLVVTLLNTHRPRDRSHYERFTAWHESFYRAVEATSVTPFSPRAIDRGIAGVTVALARLGHPGMTAPRGAMAISALRPQLDFVAELISRRAEGHDAQLSREEAETLRRAVRDRVLGLLDAWANIANRKGDLQYQIEVGGAPRLLFDPLDAELAKKTREEAQFKAARSLRDVEPAVNLWLRNPDGFEIEEEAE